MKYIAASVSILLIIKWMLWVMTFVLSGMWYSRQNAKLSQGNNDALRQSGCTVSKDSIGQRSKWGGVMPFVNGINKLSNRNVSLIPAHFIRNAIYRHCLKVHLGDNVVIYKGVVFRDGFKCRIGARTIIGDDNLIDARGGIEIGEDCNFSTGVHIWTAQHDLQDENFAYESAPVVIGSHCWISSGVTILPGISIGEGCVVASGAVVTKDCEPFSVYGGIPAKKIGNRNPNIQYQFKGTHDLFL